MKSERKTYKAINFDFDTKKLVLARLGILRSLGFSAGTQRVPVFCIFGIFAR